MKIYRKTFPDGSYVENEDVTLLPEEGVLSEIDKSATINAQSEEYYQEWLKTKVTYLLIKAEGAAIGKTGDVDYIQSQIKLYEQKYQACLTDNPIPEIDADLEAEGLRDFNMTLSEFKQLVRTMYASSRDAYNLFVHYIEQCRSAILTLMSNREWDKVEQARIIADSLSIPEDAQSVKNQILAL